MSRSRAQSEVVGVILLTGVFVVLRDGDSTERTTLSTFDVTPGDRFEVGSEWETTVTLSGEGRLFVVHTPSGTVVHESTFDLG